VGNDAEPKAGGLAANNPWLGSQVAYRFGGGDEFSDNLLVSARLLYEINLGSSKFALPVMGNVSPITQGLRDGLDEDALKQKAAELLQSSQGITVGLFPYYVMEHDRLLLTFHSVAAWRLNAFGDTATAGEGEAETGAGEEPVYLHQGRFALGAEVLIGKRDDGSAPLTVSVSPTLAVFSADQFQRAFGERKSSLFSLELTGIVPIGKGVGVLFEGIIGSEIGSESRNAFRVGLLLTSEMN
jgi:hypothetical protein